MPWYNREGGRTKKLLPKPQCFDAKMGLRSPKKSYIDAMGIHGNVQTGQDLKSGSAVEVYFNFTSQAVEKDWLASCWVATLRGNFSWDKNKEEILRECGINLRIVFIGDNLVLIQNMDDKPLDKVMSGMEEWFRYWFEYIRPWG